MKDLKESPFVLMHVECPCGDSSDAFSVREDGSGFCFSCNKNFFENELEDAAIERTPRVESATPKKTSVEISKPVGVETMEYRDLRNISRRTMEMYGVETKCYDGVPYSVGFPYHGDNGEFAVKVRVLENKDHHIIGEFRKTNLFGQHLFDPGSKPSITIFEGEFDAMAGYELLRGNSACVSIRSGAGSARRDFERRRDLYDYVNSFDKIYLCMDNDKPGKEALKSLQGLFDFKKVYVVPITKYKDANDYLVARAGEEFEAVWKSSRRFSPDNIRNSFDDIEKALDEQQEDKLGDYPWPDVNENLYGIFAGEVIVVKAGEGVGKTEHFRALEYHLLKTTKYPIGIIHLEEDNATTIKAIAGYELSVPATLPDSGLSRKDIMAGYRNAVGDDEQRVHIHSSFDIEDIESFLGNIRYLVSAAGCRFVFLDHISWLATGGGDNDQERKKLDYISQSLKLLAKELRFALIMISHINDDGKTRGSRNITKVANTVIHLERAVREGGMTTQLVIEKARLGGRSGPSGKTQFNRTTGKLEVYQEFEEKIESSTEVEPRRVIWKEE